jgi:hypothetical protein
MYTICLVFVNQIFKMAATVAQILTLLVLSTVNNYNCQLNNSNRKQFKQAYYVVRGRYTTCID